MGAERQATRRAHQYDSWENRPLQERCMTYQRSPPVPSGYNNTYQIFQTPEYVAILNEMIHDVRFIPMDGRPHVSEGIRQWNGDLRGRWEDNTLVVESKHFTDNWRDYRFNEVWRAPSETLELVERFTRLDVDTLLYRVTITDPVRFTSPWTVEMYLTTDQAAAGVSQGPIYEFACHEGNYGGENILTGARAVDKAAITESR